MRTGNFAYARFQDAVVPGLAGLHRSVRSILDCALEDGDRILVVGAGGGRELEALGESLRQYQLLGVDPSPEMLELARSTVAAAGIAGRTRLVKGTLAELPVDLHDAATSLFVMHFLPDDGSKANYLREVRRRLRPGGVYLHVDVCFASAEEYSRLAPVYVHQAQLAGLSAEEAEKAAGLVADMPIVSEVALLERFLAAGFRPVSRFFQALWYYGWWAELA